MYKFWAIMQLLPRISCLLSFTWWNVSNILLRNNIHWRLIYNAWDPIFIKQWQPPQNTLYIYFCLQLFVWVWARYGKRYKLASLGQWKWRNSEKIGNSLHMFLPFFTTFNKHVFILYIYLILKNKEQVSFRIKGLYKELSR